MSAVEPLERWPRYSQTLLRASDACLRAGYLTAKHRDGVSSHALDRGSAFHAAAERMTLDLLAAGERSFFSESEPADASMVGALVDEVLRERRDLHVPAGEADAVRAMAFHLASTLVVEPEQVLGVERKFVMDVAGREVSGILDLALLTGPREAQVVDYKTSLAVPEADEYRHSFQPRLYAALLCFGQPVRSVPCDCQWGAGPEPGDPPCPGCEGRMFVEEREPAIGAHIGYVRTREVYPRYLLESGTGLRERDHILSRTDLADFMVDVQRLVERLDEARESGEFPAVPGSHCSICPAPHECPLPRELRDYSGAVNTMEQAAEMAAWADFMGDRVRVVNRELRNFAAAHGGRIRYGRDLVRELVSVEGRAVKKSKGSSDWDGLVEAVERSAFEGVPFNTAEWIRPTASVNFKRRALTAAELDEEREEPVVVDERSADEKWGVDAPWD